MAIRGEQRDFLGPGFLGSATATDSRRRMRESAYPFADAITRPTCLSKLNHGEHRGHRRSFYLRALRVLCGRNKGRPAKFSYRKLRDWRDAVAFGWLIGEFSRSLRGV